MAPGITGKTVHGEEREEKKQERAEQRKKERTKEEKSGREKYRVRVQRVSPALALQYFFSSTFSSVSSWTTTTRLRTRAFTLLANFRVSFFLERKKKNTPVNPDEKFIPTNSLGYK